MTEYYMPQHYMEYSQYDHTYRPPYDDHTYRPPYDDHTYRPPYDDHTYRPPYVPSVKNDINDDGLQIFREQVRIIDGITNNLPQWYPNQENQYQHQFHDTYWPPQHQQQPEPMIPPIMQDQGKMLQMLFEQVQLLDKQITLWAERMRTSSDETPPSGSSPSRSRTPCWASCPGSPRRR